MSIPWSESVPFDATTADRPTLSSVALRAGVSISTVSIALAGSARVAQATRDRIFAAAAELGYHIPGLGSSVRAEDSTAAFQRFQTRVEELGGRLLEPRWLGAIKPHRAICINGHECCPVPNKVMSARTGNGNRRGICATCAGKDPVASESKFRARVAELGGRVVEPKWLGSLKPHRVICASGHKCVPIPGNVIHGRGICRTCAGKDPVATAEAFRKAVAKLGGYVVEPKWLGNGTPHRIVCAAGHDTTTWPSSVLSGNGICRYCAGQEWDVFYIVRNPIRATVKLGVTSNDARQRVSVHKRNGYTETILVLEHLRDAALLEKVTLRRLRAVGIKPVQGREYFNASALPVILGIANDWPRL